MKENNTKYISSSVLKTSEFSRVRSTSENSDVFNSRELYLHDVPSSDEIEHIRYGYSIQIQSSGLVLHENSTFRNLALAISGPFMA